MTHDPNQGTLDLEFATYDHYTVTLSKGAVGAMEAVRTHTAHTVDEAVNLIDGLRDSVASRDNVTWQGTEVDERGLLFGLAPGGTVFEIAVLPPLSTVLSK
jgi:hypothetical protein